MPEIIRRRLRRAWSVLVEEGLPAFFRRVRRHFRRHREYRLWLRQRPGVGGHQPDVEIGAEGALFSVLMPTYDTPEQWLRAAIESVRRQTWLRWQLCIADDASTRPDVRRVLEEYRSADPRIRVVFRPVNGHISAASNSALELASGEFVALLDHDDELAPHALERVATEITRWPQADLLYSDEDKLDERGRRVGPYFKPDWNPDLFLSQNFLSHLGVYRTALVRAVGGFRLGFEGSQDYDLALRVVAPSAPERVRHVPDVLYHWRMIPGSAALRPGEKTYTQDAALRAIQSFLEGASPRARAEPGFPPFYRVRYPVPDPPPRVSVLRFGEDPARLNRAAADADGDVLVFLGASSEPTKGDWLDELVSHACRPEVGVVGGRVLDRRGRIVHAGYLLALDRDPPVVSAHQGFHRTDPGQMGRAQLVQNFLAVSGDCLAVRREVFLEAGGFDNASFPRHLHDVDLCLRLRERGLRVVWTPHAEVESRASASAASRTGIFDRAAQATLRRRWGSRIHVDPYWHPALSRENGDFSLAP